MAEPQSATAWDNVLMQRPTRQQVAAQAAGDTVHEEASLTRTMRAAGPVQCSAPRTGVTARCRQ